MAKHGDVYDHFKGGEYFFDGIALPKDDLNIYFDVRRGMQFEQLAKYHDGTRDVKLYTYGGVTFIDSNVPHVIYQAAADYDTDKVYAREVDDFFGYKIKENGEAIQRFVRRKR